MLTSKQRAYLRGLANSIDPSVQVGKNGLTPDVTSAVDEALESRELIKIGVLENSMLETAETAEILHERTHSDVVSVVGRKIILYRKSKLKPVIELPKVKKS